MTLASVGSFRAAFRKMGWLADDILWLDPEPAAAFRTLIDTVAAAFPDNPPYRGVYETHVPHLTVGAGAAAEHLRSAHDQILGSLPIDFSVTTAELWCGTRQPQSWNRRAEIGRSGRPWSRAEMLEALNNEDHRPAPDTDEWEFTDLTPDLVVVTYLIRANDRESCHSSLWGTSAETPRLRFHQGTIVADQALSS